MTVTPEQAFAPQELGPLGDAPTTGVVGANSAPSTDPPSALSRYRLRNRHRPSRGSRLRPSAQSASMFSATCQMLACTRVTVSSRHGCAYASGG